MHKSFLWSHFIFSQFIFTFVDDFDRKMPPLISLSLVLKQFLFERGLNNSFNGGLSSYCLVLMVVSFLQLKGFGDQNESAGEADKKRESKMNLGQLLVEFLELFGKKFDYHKTGISLNNGGYGLQFLDCRYQCCQIYQF